MIDKTNNIKLSLLKWKSDKIMLGQKFIFDDIYRFKILF